MKARQVIEKARRDANNMLEELKKQRSEMDKQSFQRIRSAVRSSINKLDAGDIPLEAKPQDGKPLGKRAAVGMTVFVPKLSKSGECVSISGDNARVNCCGLSISCKINELFTHVTVLRTKSRISRSLKARQKALCAPNVRIRAWSWIFAERRLWMRWMLLTGL